MAWIVALMLGIPLFGAALHYWTLSHEREVFSMGAQIQATVLDVRVDEGDCIVRYAFVDPLSGKSFARSGILGFQLTQLPEEGDQIPVKYLSRNPSWSRLVGEIKLASS
jgi:hypothetical protein